MARDNVALLESLWREGRVRLARSPLERAVPPPLRPSRDRVAGMLAGLAIGDALGNASESLTAPWRRARFGLIRDYPPHPYAGGRAVGLPSDATQLAFWTLEQLLVDGGLVPEHLASRFTQGRLIGTGPTMRGFLHAYKEEGRAWYEAGQESAANGALKRIAPVLLPHLPQPSPGLWADTALAAMLTHNDRASTASSLALVELLWHVLRLERPPEPAWWAQRFLATLQPLEGDTHYQSKSPSLSYTGSLSGLLAQELPRALEEGWSVEQAADRWLSGAYLLETVPVVLHVLARHAHDPEEAIVRAVNDTWDNDTVAAVVGAVVGALHGAEALPQRWRSGLLGRTGRSDDGRIFALTEAALERWVPEG